MRVELISHTIRLQPQNSQGALLHESKEPRELLPAPPYPFQGTE